MTEDEFNKAWDTYQEMFEGKVYTVSFWYGNPETPEGEDCCDSSKDFSSLAEAKQYMANPGKDQNGCAWIMLDGPEINEVIFDRKLYKALRLEERLSANEGRMQAGMMGGCDAYNDY